MKLKLTVNDKVLSSISIDENMAGNDAYLKAYRRLLLRRHSKTLRQQTNEPLFFLEETKNNRKENLTTS